MATSEPGTEAARLTRIDAWCVTDEEWLRDRGAGQMLGAPRLAGDDQPMQARGERRDLEVRARRGVACLHGDG